MAASAIGTRIRSLPNLRFMTTSSRLSCPAVFLWRLCGPVYDDHVISTATGGTTGDPVGGERRTEGNRTPALSLFRRGDRAFPSAARLHHECSAQASCRQLSEDVAVRIVGIIGLAEVDVGRRLPADQALAPTRLTCSQCGRNRHVESRLGFRETSHTAGELGSR